MKIEINLDGELSTINFNTVQPYSAGLLAFLVDSQNYTTRILHRKYFGYELRSIFHKIFEVLNSYANELLVSYTFVLLNRDLEDLFSSTNVYVELFYDKILICNRIKMNNNS